MKNNLVIVGLGGSAESIEKEKALFSVIPAQTSAAFLVSWPSCARTGNHLPSLIKQACKLPVRMAIDKMGLEPGVVYLNTTGHILTVEGGRLRLTPQEDSERWTPVNLLFSSMGQAHKSMGVRTMGVLLDTDGEGAVYGVKALREDGGISIFRALDDMEEMPTIALEAEHVLTVSQIHELFRNRTLTLKQGKGGISPRREGQVELAETQRRLDYIIHNLREEKAKLAIVISLCADIIFEYDIRYDTMLHSSQEKLQVDVPDFVETYSKSIFEMGLVLPEDRAQLQKFVDSLRQGQELSIELRIRYNDGAYRYTEIVGSPIRNADGVSIKVVGRSKDVHARKMQEEYLLDLSKRDSLTNLYNKETIRQLVTTAIEQLADEETAYLLLVDVDKFKKINDTYGHLLGDGILCSIARALAAGFGTEALVGRIGGDEFMIFCQGMTAEEIGIQVRQINSNLRNTFSEEDCCTDFTISVGITRCAKMPESYEIYFRQADCALYYAKERKDEKTMVYSAEACGTQLAEYRTAPWGEPPSSYIIDSGEKLLLYALEVLEKEATKATALNLILSRAGTFLRFHDFVLAREICDQEQAQLVFHWENGSRRMDLEEMPLYGDLRERLDRGESLTLSCELLKGLGHNEAASAFFVRTADAGTRCYAGFLDRHQDRDWHREESTLRCLAGILSDCFHHHEELEQLELYKQRFELALDYGRLRYWEWDIKTKRLYRSTRVRDELGLGAYVEGAPEVFVESGSIHPDDAQTYLSFYRGLERGEGGVLHYRSRQIDGVYRELCITYRVILDQTGKPDRAIGIGHPLEKRQDGKAQWRSEVADLYNQKGFFHKMREVLDANNQEEFLLLLVNVNNFKAFNDLFGRSRGDELIAHVGREYRRLMEEDSLCICAHFYGDGFAILCRNRNEEVSSRLTRAHQWQHSFMPGYEFQLSAGLYVVEDPTLDASAMCDRASLALRWAKDRQERAQYYDESLFQQILLEQDICNDFEAAMREERIQIYLQPQYNMASGEMCGAEALSRWMHPVRGLISPVEFIPILEKTGKVTALDLYVTRRVCRFLSGQRKRLPHFGFSFAINVSRLDVYSNIIQELEKFLADSRLSPDSIRLEITETAYVERPKRVVEFVRKLQAAGFKVEMDDFGSGYSSLNALKDIAVDALKLDMLFLSPGNDLRGGKIITALIDMAHSMNMLVVAEGVETAEQEEMLRQAGCDVAQGYHFGRPLPMEEFFNAITV